MQSLPVIFYPSPRMRSLRVKVQNCEHVVKSSDQKRKVARLFL
jgi:hypothetical protein